jgi:hypothetical protein
LIRYSEKISEDKQTVDKGVFMINRILKIIVIFSVLTVLVSCASAPASMSPMEDQYSGESYNLSRAETSSLSNAEISSDARMVTYTATLVLSVKDTLGTRSTLIEQVGIYDGYVVRESEDFITTRIPSGNMELFLSHARTLGKIESESRSGTDITDQYRNNVIRLHNMKNVRNRYIALLERANTVADILIIEKELERVNLEIEMLEGRIRYAQQSTAYSNITVRFREKAKPGPIGWVFVGLYHGVKWLFVWN